MPVVWITGASSGLGLYAAQALRDAGFQVIAGARSFQNAAAQQDGIIRLPLDVMQEESVAAFREAALKLSPQGHPAGGRYIRVQTCHETTAVPNPWC